MGGIYGEICTKKGIYQRKWRLCGIILKQLFKKYFYDVVLYKERKPGIYTKFDEHMKRVIVLEFYKKIIQLYLEEGEGKKKNGFKTNKSLI